MWFNIIKYMPTKPATKSSQRSYVKRLVLRFIKEIPIGTKFSAHSVLKFYNSERQQKYKFEDWQPGTLQLVKHLNKHNFKGIEHREIRLTDQTREYYKEYDLLENSGNNQTIYIKGNMKPELAPIALGRLDFKHWNPDITKKEYGLLSIEDKQRWHIAMIYKYKKEDNAELKRFHSRMYKRILNNSNLPNYFSLEEMESGN